MKKDNIAKIAIFLILITCLTGVVSASEDATNHTVAASDDTTVDKVVSDADTNDAPTTTHETDLKSVDDSDKTPVTQDKKQVDDIDDSTVNDENDEQSPESPRTSPQTYDITTANYDTYIGPYGLNGNPGDTYNFVNNFANKTIYINKDNTTIKSASGVVLTNCGFSINQNIHGVTIKDLIIRNTISSYPIYVGPNCSDISIDHNNIYVDYSFVNGTWVYGIDFNAYDWGTNTIYNFHNINITDNTIRIYSNSYVCGIYGSDFIDSNVLRNIIYVYSDTGSNSAGNNAVYGISLCDDSTWATYISRPQNNKIASNTITAIGQSVYGIEDFGINQEISNNIIRVTANPTGSAYGIALGIIDNATINTNTIRITAGDLTQSISTDMIHGSNAGIRLHSNSTWGYYCNNVNINGCTILYNDFVYQYFSYYSHVQNDSGNTNIVTTNLNKGTYYDSNPYAPTYPNNVPQDRVSKFNTKNILRASDSYSILMDSNAIYVDPINGNDDYEGTESNPVKSITKALNKVISGGTIILNEGRYDPEMIYIPKSVSIKGTNREKTIIQLSDSNPFRATFYSGGEFFLDFSNLTIINTETNGMIFIRGEEDYESHDKALVCCNFTNVTFKKISNIVLSSKKSGSYFNIVNSSFINCGSTTTGVINFGAMETIPDIYLNITSSDFIDMDSVFTPQDNTNPILVNYCSFINCQNMITNVGETPNRVINLTFNNSYFGMNDAPSFNKGHEDKWNVNLDNWVVLSFENTTELHESGDAGFLLSLKNLAHADGTFTELEHPELLALPSYNVTYTLTNGTTVTSTLKNLEDATTLPLTGYGTIKATAAGQTLGITIGHDITLNIKKDGDIGYGGEQNLVFISNYNNITGNMTVTITGNNSYSKEETLDIYGGRSFLTLKGLNAGDYTVNVKYSGDDVYYPQTNSTTFKVLKVESDDITLTAYANNITFTETANIFVLINPKGATGNVTITIDGNDTTEKLDGNGVASFHIKDLSIKNYDITVKYNGDNNFETATTTAKLTVSPNTILDNLKEQLAETKAALDSNKTALQGNITKLAETQAALDSNKTALESNITALKNANAKIDNLTIELNTTNSTLKNVTKENAKLTEDNKNLNTTLTAKNAEIADLQDQLTTANNNANAKIKKITAKAKIKKTKNFQITVTLNKKVNGKYVYIIFKGKSYKAKTNKNGIAKITIPKSALKKLGGKTIKYHIIYGQSLKYKSVKVKK